MHQKSLQIQRGKSLCVLWLETKIAPIFLSTLCYTCNIIFIYAPCRILPTRVLHVLIKLTTRTHTKKSSTENELCEHTLIFTKVRERELLLVNWIINIQIYALRLFCKFPRTRKIFARIFLFLLHNKVKEEEEEEQTKMMHK